MRRYQRKGSHEGWLTSYADLITNLLIFFMIIIAASTIQVGKMERITKSLNHKEQTKSLSAAQAEINKKLTEKSLDDEVSAQLTNDGLELSFNSGVVFQSGSAEILRSMEESLGEVLAILKPYSTKYRVAIEGHTDSRPISNSRYNSNWELASSRAMSLRTRLVGLGFKEENMRVEAYGQHKPLAAEAVKDLSPQQVLAKHRRVVVRLY